MPTPLEKIDHRIDEISHTFYPEYRSDLNTSPFSLGREDTPKKEMVLIPFLETMHNTIILGAPGVGKTTAAIRLLLHQFMAHPLRLGGLVLDVKGNLFSYVTEVAELCGRQDDVYVIGPGAKSINLFYQPYTSIAKLCDEMLQVYHLVGGRKEGALTYKVAQYLVAASEIVSGMGSIPTPERILEVLHDPPQAIETDSFFLRTIHKEWSTLSGESRWQILGEASRLLLPMISDPPIRDVVSNEDPDCIGLVECLQKGKIVTVSIPRARFGMASDILVKFLKAKFFNIVTDRLSPDSFIMKRRPVFFICDEYQDFISTVEGAAGDEAFYAMNREARCACVVATQNVNALYVTATNPNAVDSILANFQIRYVMNTADDRTMKWIETWAGHFPRQELERLEKFKAICRPGADVRQKARKVALVPYWEYEHFNQMPEYLRGRSVRGVDLPDQVREGVE